MNVPKLAVTSEQAAEIIKRLTPKTTGLWHPDAGGTVAKDCGLCPYARLDVPALARAYVAAMEALEYFKQYHPSGCICCFCELLSTYHADAALHFTPVEPEKGATVAVVLAYRSRAGVPQPPADIEVLPDGK